MDNVDVLAVMDALVESCARGAAGGQVTFDNATTNVAREARAAVADLIKAADRVNTVGWYNDTRERLRSALARVQGGAA